MFKKILIPLLALSFATPAFADGGGGSYKSSPRLDPIYKLLEAEQYQQAIDEIGEALVELPEDADLLNLYAFSHRKLKRFDVALEHYQKALAIEPDHRGANEYLGELYLQLGQVDKARERLAVLDDDCFFGCAEYDKLEQAIEEYLRENPS